MGKFGGFQGGMNNMGNMQNLMKQAQSMQNDMTKKQEEISIREFEASAGGGAVIVKCSGDKVIKEIIIKKEVVDPEDIEMLQDLIKACVNEVLNKVETTMKSSMGSFNLPGFM